MPAATFPTAYKNSLLDMFCRNTALSSYNSLAAGAATLLLYSTPFGNNTGVLNAAATIATNEWSSPVAGTASFNKSITPSANGAVVWGRFNLNAAFLDGLVTTTGNGGMLIVPSTTLVNGTPVAITGTIRCPFNNGGTLRVNQELANAVLRAVLTGTTMNGIGVTAGGTPVLSIYNGTQPATADTAITTQTLLANNYTIPNGTTWAVAAGGASALTSALSGGNASASGTATWFRWTKGSFTMDGSVGTTGADMTLASTTFTANSPVPNVTGCTLTLP